MEYCAKSELHPASAGLGMLKGRQKRLHRTLSGCNLSTAQAEPNSLPPLSGRARFLDRYQGLKPLAESCHPFGISPWFRRDRAA